jgi:hypothetical protein
VIQRIADYRAEDKDDPNYYARRTVTKAQAQLASERETPTMSNTPQSPAKEEGLHH